MDGKEQLQQKDLDEIKAKLKQELDDILKNTSETIGVLQELAVDEYSDPSDRAYLESERNLNLRIRDRERKLIGKITKAINRIEEGSYGDCDECGEPIGKNRLLARPVTDLCVDCKEKQEQVERQRKYQQD